MFVNFNDLPDHARVWIYQADRPLTDREVETISVALDAFTKTWKAHGNDLKSSYLIKYEQFIIIAVDEGFNAASGCSIDASVHIIQEIEKELNLDLMNKMIVSFKDGENINTVSMEQFKEFARLNKINDKTLVFNNMVAQKSEFESNWEIEAAKSWHARYLN